MPHALIIDVRHLYTNREAESVQGKSQSEISDVPDGFDHHQVHRTHGFVELEDASKLAEEHETGDLEDHLVANHKLGEGVDVAYFFGYT